MKSMGMGDPTGGISGKGDAAVVALRHHAELERA
jgi:hypothetical protein